MNNLFDRDKNQFMRRWGLLTNYAKMIQNVLDCKDGTDTAVVMLITQVTKNLNHPDDECPMDIINYVNAYIGLENALPPLQHLVDKEDKYTNTQHKSILVTSSWPNQPF